MDLDVEKLNDHMLDILKEIGNIGAGNAATALASMIDTKVDMEVPNVMVLEFDDVSTILGGEENLVVGIYFELSGDITGNMMFALDLDSSKNLSDILYTRERLEKELDEMDMSVLSEIGNILASSYANSLAQLTGLDIFISIPSIAIDMSAAILSVPAIQFGLIADHALMIETVFKEGKDRVSGNFFLLPELESFKKILISLGVV